MKKAFLLLFIVFGTGFIAGCQVCMPPYGGPVTVAPAYAYPPPAPAYSPPPVIVYQPPPPPPVVYNYNYYCRTYNYYIRRYYYRAEPPCPAPTRRYRRDP